jgi:hypothetical protein
MDIMKWLEPSIEKRIYEVTESCCQTNYIVEANQQFVKILQELKLILPNDRQSIVFDLESVYNINSGLLISASYRNGLDEGIKLATHFRIAKLS